MEHDGGSAEGGTEGCIGLADEAGTPVLMLRGEIDSAAVEAFDDRALTIAGPAVIDVSGVTFLDCRGLGLLVRLARAARRRGARPVLRRPPRMVRRVLDLAGAADEFTVVC